MSVTRKIFLFIGLPLIIVFAVVIVWAFQEQNTGSTESTTETANNDGSKTTTECPAMISPVDVSLATSILYPGQTRGNDYKAHGGFRFDNSKNEDITVKSPYDASVSTASRYIQSGEVQYLIEFQTDCGLNFRFDHLKTLSPKLQAMMEQLPKAKVDDSRTSSPNTAVDVTAGETIATAVGFAAGPNVSVDFGVYDKTKRNQASQDATWAAEHEAEQDQDWYGICWFDLLPAADAAIVKALPGSGGSKISDYCL